MTGFPKFKVTVIQGPMTIQNKRSGFYEAYVGNDAFVMSSPLAYDLSNLSVTSTVYLRDAEDEHYISIIGPFIDIDIRKDDKGDRATLWTNHGSVLLLEVDTHG